MKKLCDGKAVGIGLRLLPRRQDEEAVPMAEIVLTAAAGRLAC
jgi:hypothetical protein